MVPGPATSHVLRSMETVEAGVSATVFLILIWRINGDFADAGTSMALS